MPGPYTATRKNENMNIIEITDLSAPELAPYTRLTEAQLRNKLEPEKGIFIAESPKVIGTALDGPGGCISTPSEGVIMNFGALENNELTQAAGKYMEDCFNKGGCEAVFREDVLPFIWKKVTVNCTVNTVCAVTRLKIGFVENNPYGKKLFHNVIRECCAVANAKGVKMDADEFIRVDHQHIIDNISDYYPSMAQDMLYKKLRTEVDTLTGAISDYGKQFNIPTPTCDVLSDIVRCIQDNYDNQYGEKNGAVNG